MKNYHVTIMSIDPAEDPDDNHQKYGLNVKAKNEKEADEKGKTLFMQQNPRLPVFWVKSCEVK